MQWENHIHLQHSRYHGMHLQETVSTNDSYDSASDYCSKNGKYLYLLTLYLLGTLFNNRKYIRILNEYFS